MQAWKKVSLKNVADMRGGDIGIALTRVSNILLDNGG